MATPRPERDDRPTLRIIPSPTPPPIRWKPPVAERWLQANEVLARRYRILELVGCGGMGMVYRAQDEQLGLCVALKVLRPELADDSRLIERFRRELVLARQVSHRNVVRIHDIGQDGGLLFLTMDFVPGRSLHKLLGEEGPLEPRRAAEILRQLALALEAAHEAEVIHRDLKPANVLVEDSGRACVSDFGVARSLGSSGLTRAGAVVGTVSYLSPEQARGEAVDARSDLYSLGILFFEMLTGELPFAGGSVGEALAQRATGATRDVQTLRPEVPAHFAAILRRLLARDPAARFQSARELIDALDGTRRPPRRNRLRRRFRNVATTLILPALLAIGWAIVPEDRPPVSPPAQAATGPRHVVAVLPLVDETGRSDLAWVSTGLAEMLAISLGESRALRVVDSGRVVQTVEDLKLRHDPLEAGDLRRLTDLLGADRLITGRVRSAGSRLRVDLKLIASDLAALPATALHGERASAGEIFTLADSLGRSLRQRLEVKPPEEPVAASASPAAARAYAQGIGELLRRDQTAAARSLEEAVRLDAGFAPAWVALARVRAGLGHHREALEAARRAVASLGPRSGRAAFQAQALEARLRGDPEKARETLSTLVDRYPYDVEARVELAETCGELGDLGAAIAHLRRVVAIDSNHPRAWLLLARNSILAGDSRRAVNEYLVRALVIQNRLGSEPGKAEVLNALGVAYNDLGELDRAVESYEQAAEIRRRVGDERGLAATLRNLAAVHAVRGEQQRAGERLAEAREILDRLGDPAGLADLANDLGLLAEEQGRYQEAMEHYRQGLQLRRRLGQTLAIAESLNNVGYACYLLGRFDDAMVYGRQALELYRQGGDRAGWISGTQGIGLLQTAQGDWDAALKSFLESLRVSRDLGLKESTAAALGHVGRIELLQGRFGAALTSFEEALKMLRELEDVRGQTEFTLAAAETWMEIGDLDAARQQLEAAEKLLAAGQNREQKADLLRLRGEWHHRRGEANLARQAFRKAVTEAEASHGIVTLLQARLARARLEGKSAASELRSLRTEAERLCHRLLQLQASEALAEISLSRGELADAESAARAGLETARETGAYAGAWRLHLLLARTLERSGRAAEAADQRARAEAEVGRLQAQLAEGQRRSFTAIAEVRRLLASG